jgi:hypothetical protein
MSRARIATLLSALALAAMARTRANAQSAAHADSSGMAVAVAPPGVVRVTSRHLPFEARDLMLANCAWLSQDALGYLVPYLCVRHMSGTLEHVDGDSIVFIRHGQPVRVAMRNVRALEQLNGRSRTRTVVGGVVGGAIGVIYAGVIGIAGAYRTDSQFIATAAVLAAGGAAVGAYSGGRRWSEWPRTYTVPSTAER